MIRFCEYTDRIHKYADLLPRHISLADGCLVTVCSYIIRDFTAHCRLSSTEITQIWKTEICMDLLFCIVYDAPACHQGSDSNHRNLHLSCESCSIRPLACEVLTKHCWHIMRKAVRVATLRIGSFHSPTTVGDPGFCLPACHSHFHYPSHAFALHWFLLAPCLHLLVWPWPPSPWLLLRSSGWALPLFLHLLLPRENKRCSRFSGLTGAMGFISLVTRNLILLQRKPAILRILSWVSYIQVLLLQSWKMKM